MTDDVVAVIDPTGPRRYIAIGMLLMLGGLLLYVALTPPAVGPIWQIVLTLLAALAAWSAQRLHQATSRKLFLTEKALTDSDGTVLAAVTNIAAVNRGVFAIKPSNGFMLTLKDPAPFAWQPGLWWRVGRRLAVGGVTPGGQTRPMADIISVMIARSP
ncbi:hypothetical protein [Marivita sp. GX14005]|uniref:hypothetical protein n=1 Tax=Marivita sp. GX14005 TaxID=2942276 RepID=UPI0020185FBB|nr:hypothetical protein [Marivita sp. GX14005]MCL3881176.1 hypothetical protein [Marivita sp. GX14005]